MKPKTQLKWKVTREDGNVDYFAKLRVDKKTVYYLLIELSPSSPTGDETEVRRVIWLGDAELPMFEDVEVHDTDISFFTRELKGMEWNILAQLRHHLLTSIEAVDKMMFAGDKAT